MNYLFYLALISGLAVKWPFIEYPAKSGIYGLFAICSLLPVVKSLGKRICRASGGGRLAMECLEAVTIGSSRCIGTLPYPDATLLSLTRMEIETPQQ